MGGEKAAWERGCSQVRHKMYGEKGSLVIVSLNTLFEVNGRLSLTLYSTFPAVIRFSDLTRVQCIDLNVSDDQIVEEGETILLSLLPLDMPYMLESGSVTNAVVMVIDDDGIGTYMACTRIH